MLVWRIFILQWSHLRPPPPISVRFAPLSVSDCVAKMQRMFIGNLWRRFYWHFSNSSAWNLDRKIRILKVVCKVCIENAHSGTQNKIVFSPLVNFLNAFGTKENSLTQLWREMSLKCVITHSSLKDSRYNRYVDNNWDFTINQEIQNHFFSL